MLLTTVERWRALSKRRLAAAANELVDEQEDKVPGIQAFRLVARSGW